MLLHVSIQESSPNIPTSVQQPLSERNYTPFCSYFSHCSSEKKTIHPTTLYGQLYKKDTKGIYYMYLDVLCLTCFKNCLIFIWQYMEPNTKCFMCSTSSYSTLLPTYLSLRTTGHSTQLTQKPFSTFKPKIVLLKKPLS